MQWNIPGTKLFIAQEDADGVQDMFESMFLPGDMVLSQVSGITGLEAYTIQNWVKRGFLSPPRNKRYDMEQVCRIILINMLKGALTLDQIVNLISYINGSLTDESDDTIDDAVLYFKFVSLAARARHIGGTKEWGEALIEVMADYTEPIPGAKERIIKVLHIMLTAWIASRLRLEAEQMLNNL